MSALPTRSKDAIVATIAAAMQGRTAKFLNFAVGSVMLAFAEAMAGVALWLQAEILQVLKVTRAATSDALDLDSFVADYGVTRLGAVPASGIVSFSRYTAGPSTVLIPVGAQVQTGDGSQRFTVYADSTIASYSPSQSAYVMLAQVSGLDVPVQANVAGPDGNVGAGAISLIASAVSGIDAVTNAAGFTNGSGEETDEALRTRFQLFFPSLSKATDTAIKKAIADLGVNLQCSIVHNDPAKGQPYVTVVVDDGSGNPPDILVQQASAAVGNVRAAGVWVPVVGATTAPATIAMQIAVSAGYYKPDVVAQVGAAVTLFVNGLGLGTVLRYTRLEHVAYSASPGVTNVTGVTLNGATLDLDPGPTGTVKLSSVNVS